jgi:hypothetical protein
MIDSCPLECNIDVRKCAKISDFFPNNESLDQMGCKREQISYIPIVSRVQPANGDASNGLVAGSFVPFKENKTSKPFTLRILWANFSQVQIIICRYWGLWCAVKTAQMQPVMLLFFC